jgi:hypothetical protein
MLLLTVPGSPVAAAAANPLQWNEALLEAAVAPAYAVLLLEAAQILGPSKAFWQLLPAGQLGAIPQPWLRAAAALYARLSQQPVLWSPVGQGAWLTPVQVLLPDAACYVASSSKYTNAATAELNAVSASGSAADAEDAGALAPGCVGGRLRASCLAQLLVACGVPLVMSLSEEQQRCLLQWTPGTQQVSKHELCCSGRRQKRAGSDCASCFSCASFFMLLCAPAEHCPPAAVTDVHWCMGCTACYACSLAEACTLQAADWCVDPVL